MRVQRNNVAHTHTHMHEYRILYSLFFRPSSNSRCSFSRASGPVIFRLSALLYPRLRKLASAITRRERVAISVALSQYRSDLVFNCHDGAPVFACICRGRLIKKSRRKNHQSGWKWDAWFIALVILSDLHAFGAFFLGFFLFPRDACVCVCACVAINIRRAYIKVPRGHLVKYVFLFRVCFVELLFVN